MLFNECPPVFENLYHHCGSWFRCCSNNNYIINTLHHFYSTYIPVSAYMLYITILYINYRKNRQPGKQSKRRKNNLKLYTSTPMLFNECPPVFENLFHHCGPWFRCCSNNYIINTLHIFIVHTFLFLPIYYTLYIIQLYIIQLYKIQLYIHNYTYTIIYVYSKCYTSYLSLYGTEKSP